LLAFGFLKKRPKEFEVTKKTATAFLFHNDEFMFMTQEEAVNEITKRLAASFKRRITRPGAPKRARSGKRWTPSNTDNNGFGNGNNGYGSAANYYGNSYGANYGSYK
jgi:hypothetical protein